METEKENNYSVVNQFQANVPFLHPLKTAETFLFFRCVLGVKKGNIGLKWVDNSGREIISIRNNATLIYGINAQNATSTKTRNNNVISGVILFISEKFKGSHGWYFKSDIAEFEFDYTNQIKLKTFIDKIRNLTKFSIFFSFSFKSLMTWSISGRKTWRVWLKDLLLTEIYWLVIDHYYFFLYCHQIITKIAIWMLAGGRIAKTRKTDIAFKSRHELSRTSRVIGSPCRVEFWKWSVSYDCPLCFMHDNSYWQVL